MKLFRNLTLLTVKMTITIIVLTVMLSATMLVGCSNSKSKEVSSDEDIFSFALDNLDKVTETSKNSRKTVKKNKNIVDGIEEYKVDKSDTQDGVKITVDKIINVYHEELSKNKDGEQVQFYPVVYLTVENQRDKTYKFSGVSITGMSDKEYNGADSEINKRAIEFVDGERMESQVYLEPGEKVSGYILMNSTEKKLTLIKYQDIHMKKYNRIEL